MKRALKIFAALIVTFVIILIAIPFLFGGTIKDKIRFLANEHLNATVDFEDVNISLLSSFPSASVEIDNFSIINKAPFAGDTLAYTKRIAVNMAFMEIFKGADEPIAIKRFVIDNAKIAVKTDSLGRVNYDITKPDNSPETSESNEEESGSFTFALDHYEINDAQILYKDDQGKMELLLTKLNHSGDGTFSGDNILLDTHSSTLASFDMEGTNYLKNNSLKLDAELELDLKNQKYTFKDNKALINLLPLEFTGFVQLAEKYTDIDLSFKTPTSDFKNLLGLIPSAYANSLDGVKTSGNFSVDGIVKGKVDDKHIPTLDIKLLSQNASFRYPDLPKSVQNIHINTEIKNKTGLVDDTYITINNLTFRIDEDTFGAKGSISNLTKNMFVDMGLHGTMNLANINKAYPMELEQELNGKLKADIDTKFDMQSLEKEQYQKVKTAGEIQLNDFKYTSEELPNAIAIEEAHVGFEPETITLDKMKMTSGNSDISATGAINNLMGFLFAKQDLKGTFDVNSNVFSVNDFMVAETETSEEEVGEAPDQPVEENLAIPSFLDATLNFNAKKVLYDNLELKNTKGSVKIKDETAYLSNVTSQLFDGTIGFDGKVSTKGNQPNFGMEMDLQNINIAKSFAGMEIIRNLAPIAKALTGALTTNLKLNGNLNDDLTPVLTSLKGNALAEILNAKVSTAETPLLSKLDGQMNFLKLDKLNLKDIKTKLDFDDGKINVKPFEFEVEGIKIAAGGSHSFDQNMNYNLVVDVPAKYLGNEASSLLSRLSDQEASNTKVPLPIGIKGNFSNPQINLNTGNAIKSLTQQLINKQKNKVKDQVATKGTKLLTDLLGGTNKETENKDTTTDEEKNNTDIKETAKNILGGFLKKRNKKDTTNNKN